MTESEIAAEADREAAASCGVLTEFEAAEAAFARCHAITGLGPERCLICDAWPCSCVWEDAPQPAQSGVNPMPPQNARTLSWHDPQPPVPDRIAELEARVVQLEGINQGLCCLVLTRESELDAMTQERDIALLRMEVAIATSHAWIDAEVRRRIAEAGQAPAFPERALRQQRQSIGLLSTADAGRVRLGGYAPSLPPR